MILQRAEAINLLTAAGQPYELAEIGGPGRCNRVFCNAPDNLPQIFAQARSDADFLVYENERLTFEQVWSRSAALAGVMAREFGIKEGDRVAISMRNFPEWVLAFNATTMLGGIAVALNALWQSQDMSAALLDCRPKLLFVDRERWGRLQSCAEEVRTVSTIVVRAKDDLPGTSSHFRHLPFVDAQTPYAQISPDDDAIMMFTSGSTGRPKGAVSTHRSIITALLSWELDAEAGRLMGAAPPVPVGLQQAALLAVPLFHISGLHAGLLQCYRAQRRLVCMYKWAPAEALTIIERERITHFNAPPTMTGDLIEEARYTNRHLSSLIRIGGGGAARSAEQVRAISTILPNATPSTGWGMTETNGIGVGISGEDYRRRPTSSGRLSAALEARIVDEDGVELQPNQRGELQVRGASMMRGYWNREAANVDAFVDGWFRTGDIAVFDEEGFLYVVDRIKDLVIRGGENIGCGAVEAALLEHPDVVEASVYGVPDARLGEEVGATIHARSDVTQAALTEFLTDRLAAFEIPRYIEISADPLPRTASGKIYKYQLRSEATARLTGKRTEFGQAGT